MGVLVGAVVTMLVIYGAMELAYRMGEQTACLAKTSFQREYAPALRDAYEYADEYGKAEFRQDDKLRDAGQSIVGSDRRIALHGGRVAFAIRDVISAMLEEFETSREYADPARDRAESDQDYISTTSLTGDA